MGVSMALIMIGTLMLLFGPHHVAIGVVSWMLMGIGLLGVGVEFDRSRNRSGE